MLGNRLKHSLANAADGGAILLAGGSGAVVVQYCCGASGWWFRGCSNDQQRAALFQMAGIKFLLADVIRLFAGEGGYFRFVGSTAGAE